MRLDGRKQDELRHLIITPNFTNYAEGSVLIVAGQTRVLCNATLEENIPRWMQSQEKSGGWITAEYSLLPRSTQRRTPRENNGIGGRTHEIRRLIGRSLRAAVDLELLGQRTLIIDCDVLQADGGTRTASITGGYVALALAIRRLARQGVIPHETLKKGIAAISVGIVDGQPILDLDYSEDSRAEVDTNVVMDADGRFIEIQGTAEGQPFDRSHFEQMLDLAWGGIQQLLTAQQNTLASSFKNT